MVLCDDLKTEGRDRDKREEKDGGRKEKKNRKHVNRTKDGIAFQRVGLTLSKFKQIKLDLVEFYAHEQYASQRVVQSHDASVLQRRKSSRCIVK